MRKASKTVLFAVLILFGLCGTAHADPAGSAGPAPATGEVRAFYCVGIPYVGYGGSTIYPGGEVCVPGP
jgi:hypothetical protein